MKRAFTLPELLVVVAILALLAAMLFPVFARARENARRASCQGNEKQLFLAHSLYKEDYDGVFAPAAYRDASGLRLTWRDLFMPYARGAQLFACSSDTTSNALSYGVNSRAFADVENVASGGNVHLGTLRFEATSELVLLAESGTGNDFQSRVPDAWKIVPPSQPLAFPGDARPCARHFDRANVLFLDGHVQALALEAFYRGQTPPDRFFAP